MIRKCGMFLLSLLIWGAQTAMAHEEGHGGGFVSGLSHPILGFDHLLAMVSVGILSAQMGGRAIWVVPATFVLVMLFGGMLGMNQVPFLPVEIGIAISVIALGIALVAEKKLPMVLAMLFVGFFAIFHGHAHGTEMPELAQPWSYAAGFIAGTAAIHIAGVAIGLVSNRSAEWQQGMRYIGAGIAGIGVHLVLTL